MKTVHITPSDPHYLRNLVAYMRPRLPRKERVMTDRHYIEFTVQAADVSQVQFEAIVDEVSDRLAESGGVIDPDLGADLDKREITLCMTVEAAGVEQAIDRVLAVARAALHAAGGETLGWESINFSIPARSGNRRLLAL